MAPLPASDYLLANMRAVPLAAEKLVSLHLRTPTDDASIIDILDRILDKGIGLDPSVRLLLSGIDLRTSEFRVVVAPDRRRRPFSIPFLKRH